MAVAMAMTTVKNGARFWKTFPHFAAFYVDKEDDDDDDDDLTPKKGKRKSSADSLHKQCT